MQAEEKTNTGKNSFRNKRLGKVGKNVRVHESSGTQTGENGNIWGRAGDVSDYEPGGEGASGGIAEKAVKSTLRRYEKENKPRWTCVKQSLKL